MVCGYPPSWAWSMKMLHIRLEWVIYIEIAAFYSAMFHDLSVSVHEGTSASHLSEMLSTLATRLCCLICILFSDELRIAIRLPPDLSKKLTLRSHQSTDSSAVGYGVIALDQLVSGKITRSMVGENGSLFCCLNHGFFVHCRPLFKCPPALKREVFRLDTLYNALTSIISSI